MGETQSRSVMLHQQDRAQNSAYSGQGSMSSSLRNRKCDKDSNFNFLPDKDDEGVVTMNAIRGDENRNQVRPRNLSPLGRDPPPSSSSPGLNYGLGPLSPLSRLPCWSPLEPLPEIESGDDGYGRVPPDGAEEGKIEEEESRGSMLLNSNEEKGRVRRHGELPRRKSGVEYRGREEDEEEEEEGGLEDGDEWGDSDSDFEFSYRSGGSLSSLNMESGGEGVLMGGWDRVGVGEPRSNHDHQGGTRKTVDNARMPETAPGATGKQANLNRDPTARRRSIGCKALSENSLLEEEKPGRSNEDQSSDSEGEVPELMDAVWTLRDRERFKAQEMEKHQVQLTMYRRLALIRWVRTLQGRVQEQQNRLQSSFDVILMHRKELLRMGTAATIAAVTPTAAVGQS